ncbi:CLUMA_CG018527, isoform A [Clunio marinus]|uniref:CLUMA_CG018527, isoform A n=1 Tax=Clunio marinus TaxID=568069 RepID=A0A1J1IXR4_9DIPT|nr:CLUMA_CG018527, isoform A [Clunio marinus]
MKTLLTFFFVLNLPRTSTMKLPATGEVFNIHKKPLLYECVCEHVDAVNEFSLNALSLILKFLIYFFNLHFREGEEKGLKKPTKIIVTHRSIHSKMRFLRRNSKQQNVQSSNDSKALIKGINNKSPRYKNFNVNKQCKQTDFQ